LHSIGNKLRVNVLVIISGSTLCNFIQELTEVYTNWQIDKNILIETGIVIAFNRLDVLKLWETTKWVSSSHKFFKAAVALETLDNENNIVNLIAVEQLLKECAEWVYSISWKYSK